MPDPLAYSIRPTRDPAHFAAGARMMMTTDPWIRLGFTYEACLQAFDGPCKEIYILESGGDLAGFVILQVCGSFSGYIQTLCVAGRFRGQGLGRELLRFSEERIHQLSPNVFICVSDFNEPARTLYEAWGFELVGTLKNFVRDGVDELLLRKTLGPRMGYIPPGNAEAT
ncbi:MAG TPA: GNAT family N-acetyltransferase [Chitinophagaceae bacterium]|nr:GNAT family N-acetyltransferase [Chitinophagaceae bacterium]